MWIIISLPLLSELVGLVSLPAATTLTQVSGPLNQVAVAFIDSF